MSSIGIVVIGRNEGERLKNCIRSLSHNLSLRIVYVDSASTDDSVAFVKAQGFDVVELDMSLPFSAARARNEGYRFLRKQYANINFIQFVDGDCEVHPDWLNLAEKRLQTCPKLAAVCGRRKERYPEKTIYNKLCDIEWDTPIGEAMATGGDFLCRSGALEQVNGFNPQVIAGEEPELCFRLRREGWNIERLDAPMTLHDANMTSIKQWFKRSERSGHAYAQGFAMHGRSEEAYYRRDIIRIIFWAFVLPIGIFVSSFAVSAACFLGFFIYPAKIMQITNKEAPKYGAMVASAYAASLVMGKFPQLKGVFNYYVKRASGRNFQIIEYKGPNE